MTKKSPFGLLFLKNWSPKVSFRRLFRVSHKSTYPAKAHFYGFFLKPSLRYIKEYDTLPNTMVASSYIFIEGITDEALEVEQELLKHIGDNDNDVHDTMVNKRMTTIEIQIKNTEGVAACLTLRE